MIKYLINSLPTSNDYVICVTGDHTTPCIIGDHTFEPVPILISTTNNFRVNSIYI